MVVQILEINFSDCIVLLSQYLRNTIIISYQFSSFHDYSNTAALLSDYDIHDSSGDHYLNTA